MARGCRDRRNCLGLGRRDRGHPQRLADHLRRVGGLGRRTARRSRVAVVADPASAGRVARARRSGRGAPRVVLGRRHEHLSRVLGGRDHRRARARRSRRPPKRSRRSNPVRRSRSRASEVVRVSITIAVVVAVAAVVIAPVLSDHLGRHVWPGSGSHRKRLCRLAHVTHARPIKLDMTQRPRALRPRRVHRCRAARRVLAGRDVRRVGRAHVDAFGSTLRTARRERLDGGGPGRPVRRRRAHRSRDAPDVPRQDRVLQRGVRGAESGVGRHRGPARRSPRRNRGRARRLRERRGVHRDQPERASDRGRVARIRVESDSRGGARSVRASARELFRKHHPGTTEPGAARWRCGSRPRRRPPTTRSARSKRGSRAT